MRRHAPGGGTALALVLAASLVLPSVGGATEAGSSLADYRRRVDEAYAYAAKHLPGAWEDPLAAQQVAGQLNTYLPGAERVRVGTRTIDVDNSVLRSLIARLDSSKSASERRETAADIEAHLGSLKLAVDEGSARFRDDRALLAGLLARSDLASRPTLADELAKLLDRFTGWVQEWFSRLMRRKGAATAGDIGLGIVFVALAALLVLAVVQVVRGISAALARRDRRVMDERAADAAAVVAAAEGLPPDALAYAEELAAAGCFREAVRALFGGAARALVDLGLVRSARTRTNAELLADLAPAAPPVVPPLSELSSQFERAWYGHADPGERGYGEARERYRASVRSAERARSERLAEREGS